MASHTRLEDPARFPKWGTDEWHDFLVLTDTGYARQDDPMHPFERAIELRRIIDEDVPDTTTTFNLTDYVPEQNSRPYTEKLLALCGTWRVPDDLVPTHSTARVVNPNSAHAHLYSDATAICECGHPVRRPLGSRSGAVEQLPGRGEHTADCTVEMRNRAREELAENRRRLYTLLAHLGHRPSPILQRLGYAPDSSDLPRKARSVGITDPLAVRREGRRRMLRTMLVLLRTESAGTVGRVYGISARDVTRRVTNETTADSAGLHTARRRAQNHAFEYPLGFAWKPTKNKRLDSGLPLPFARRQVQARADGGTVQ